MDLVLGPMDLVPVIVRPYPLLHIHMCLKPFMLILHLTGAIATLQYTDQMISRNI